MSLNQYAAERRRALFEDLSAGQPPREGEFDPAVLKEGQMKGAPQMGSTRYAPDAIFVEFIYPDKLGKSVILTVKLEAPERIVYLPVPGWVVESIWQGEISGSFHFESDARRMMAELENQLDPEPNKALFGPKQATRRE